MTRHARIIDDFLAAEVGSCRATLGEIEEHVCAADTWQFGGDACHLTVHGDQVTVENGFNDESATMSRAGFLRVLADRGRIVPLGQDWDTIVVEADDQ